MRTREAGPAAPRQRDLDVYATMNDVAARAQAVNLGQAMPAETPLALLEAAGRAVADGHNHYTPSMGTAALRAAVADSVRQRRLHYDPDTEVTILAGCTEAIAASMLATLSPGDEVLTCEPFYDSYPSFAELAGARLTSVPLRLRAGRYVLDLDMLERAVTARTRMLLINSPHNPTGMVLTTEDLLAIADIAERHDLLVLSDEVYEELTYGRSAPSAGAITGLRERTIVCSSITKSLSASGWRVGWALAPAELTRRLRHTHRFVSYCAPAPLQAAAASALRWAGETGYFHTLRSTFTHRRDLLVAGLAAAGMSPVHPDGGVVTIASVRHLSGLPRGLDAVGAATWIAHRFGVAGLPLTTYFEQPGRADGLIRFTFAKDVDSLALAVQRLHAPRSSRVGGNEAAM